MAKRPFEVWTYSTQKSIYLLSVNGNGYFWKGQNGHSKSSHLKEIKNNNNKNKFIIHQWINVVLRVNRRGDIKISFHY